jgi:dipicolinate synthase subunit A
MQRIVIAGGDSRDVWLGQMLQQRGHHVRAWGLAAPGIAPYVVSDEPPTVLIGPMTGVGDDGWMQTQDGRVRLNDEVLKQMGPGALVAAGLIGPGIVRRCQELNIRTIQYRQEATFMWLNAVPTAEGAIAAAVGRSGRTLFERPIGVVGYGRVGAVLADRLARYGARPVVFDRSPDRRAMARALGHKSLALEAPARPLLDGAFNTVPAPVLDGSWFDLEGPEWVIDLASVPGGLIPDLRGASFVADRYEQILGIPGKVAPVRAAEIIWETLSLALEEEWQDGETDGRARWSRNGGFPL